VADGQALMLLTNERRIVAIDLSRRRARRLPLAGLESDDKLAGLGRSADGSLWTLAGWSTLLRLTETGTVVERRRMHVGLTGLHSGFERLLYQPLTFAGGAAALVTIDGDGEPIGWGALTVRDGAEQGPIRLAQSFVSCGVAVADRMPCWLSNASSVEIEGRRAVDSVVPIPALAPWVATDATAFAQNPHRVIRDVWLAQTNEMWLLVRASATDVPDRQGERGLWRVDMNGDVRERRVLNRRARALLGVDSRRVWVLTAEGDVVVEEM